MRQVILAMVAGLMLVLGSGVQAQDRVWLQIEAQPSLTAAQSRARAYAGRLDNVNGFYLGSGWYGVVLGPYSSADADRLGRELRSNGSIPRDAFVADGDNFSQQFWPVGVNTLDTQPREAPSLPSSEPDSQDLSAPETTETSEIVPADETPQQARASEAQLSRSEREELQIALRWAGFYDAAIDGAFGRGTRAAMREWQETENFEPTGILTSRQRADLLAAYDAVLDGMDIEVVSDDQAGVRIAMPRGAVAFDDYKPPFARYDATGKVEGAEVLLISQPGDASTLSGLYQIMQTLEIVPPEGERFRSGNSFELEGIGSDVHSYTYARLDGGAIKGFTLVWPAGDEARRSRILREMRTSFEPVAGVLDPSLAEPTENQAIDLVSGLSVRTPKVSRSGFFIDGEGHVLTTTEAIDSCGRITINEDTTATVAYSDDALGLALLAPTTPLAPSQFARFQARVPRLQSEIAVAGYPFEGALSAPSVTFGTLVDIRGLSGEETLKRLELEAQPGDAGGPVFDMTGATLGMLLPSAQSGRQLPPDVAFLLDSEALGDSLDQGGVEVTEVLDDATMTPEVLTRQAMEMTVLISCWP